MSRIREGTVKNLQELYTVAVGVALVGAIEEIVKVRGTAEIRWWHLFAFTALLATLIPFYHGALRHLDQRYIEDGEQGFQRQALLWDFLLLFVEACLLIGIAKLVGDIGAVGLGIAALLIVDSLWGGAIVLFAARTRDWSELEWVKINLVAGPVLVVGILATRALPHSQRDGVLKCFVPAVAIIRTIVDYKRAWHFYFPWHVVDRHSSTHRKVA